MNANRIFSTIVTLTAAAAFAAAMPASAEQIQPASVGSAAAAASAGSIVTITPHTKYVNVADGSTVRFVVDGQSFTWNFHTSEATVKPFDLALLAPAGVLKQKVVVYVSPDPLYLN